ncbi:MAG TPA: 50S ribosomal protein L32 [Peptococcaceae bacterium]|nr:50S ribosomal protein L32 [Peptococcaceae bacterium]
MGVPKRRTSKQRKRLREAQQKLTAPHLVRCPQCHAPVVPHRVCPECGYYKARKVIGEK